MDDYIILKNKFYIIISNIVCQDVLKYVIRNYAGSFFEKNASVDLTEFNAYSNVTEIKRVVMINESKIYFPGTVLDVLTENIIYEPAFIMRNDNNVLYGPANDNISKVLHDGKFVKHRICRIPVSSDFISYQDYFISLFDNMLYVKHDNKMPCIIRLNTIGNRISLIDDIIYVYNDIDCYTIYYFPIVDFLNNTIERNRYEYNVINKMIIPSTISGEKNIVVIYCGNIYVYTNKEIKIYDIKFKFIGLCECDAITLFSVYKNSIATINKDFICDLYTDHIKEPISPKPLVENKVSNNFYFF